jgi:succinate dehydrogenase/fumarate reductase flavoprotein subunit
MKRDLQVYEEFFAWKLVIDDDRCQGVIAWDLLNGGLKTIGAKTVVLATGGAGGSTPARRTRTRARVTEWRWPCRPGCRSRTWR